MTLPRPSRGDIRQGRRWTIVLALVLVAGAAASGRTQSLVAIARDLSAYRDLVAVRGGTYGIELRGGATHLVARVGPDTSRSEGVSTLAFPAVARQTFRLTWSAGAVVLRAGDRTIEHRSAWQIGNAIRISTTGRVRVKVSEVTGMPVQREVAATSAARGDLVVIASALDRGWWLEGTIDWPDQPGTDDGVVITTGRTMFTGGAGGPGLTPEFQEPRAAPPSRTWSGAASALWSDPRNWSPAGVPATSDVLTFPAQGSKKDTVNDVPGLTVGGVTVLGSGYSIGDNGLLLAANSQSRVESTFQVSSLTGAGTITFPRSAQFVVDQSHTTTFGGTFIGSGGELVKRGPGTLVFTGLAVDIDGTEIRNGTFLLDGGALSDVSLSQGPGDECRFAITNGGRIGRLNSNACHIGSLEAGIGSTAEFAISGGSFLQRISGPDDFQRFRVSGGVDIRNVTLTVQLTGGFRPAEAALFIIIDNDGSDEVTGPTSNRFTGLGEGARFTVDGVEFSISYLCNNAVSPARCDGSGNDIGLIVAGAGPAASPDLAITKTLSGPFVRGGTGTFSLTVRNDGTAPTSGTVTVVDDLPTGLSPDRITADGWGCTISGQHVSCTRASSLAPGGTYPAIVIAVLVALDAQSTTNAATVSTAGDRNASNDRSQIDVPVGGVVDLTLDKTHGSDFEQGGTGSYSLVISNAGSIPSSDTITVTDVIPAGLTPTSANGTNWACNINQQSVTCTRGDALAPGASFPAIQLAVSIAPTAPSTVTNTASVSGGNAPMDDNNTDSDVTPIAPVFPDLTIVKAQVAPPFLQGQTGAKFTVTVTNGGRGPTTGTVTVADTLPAGLTPTDANGTGWTCTTSGQTVSCTRSDPLAAGASYPPVTLTVNVAPAAAGLANTAAVSGGGDNTPGNNSMTIPVDIEQVSVDEAPDLIVNKTHTGEVAEGGAVTFQIVVRNIGSGPSAGDIVVTDPIPAGLTPTAASGDGWSCTIAPTVSCTRAGALAPGESAATIALTVSVSTMAQSATNVVTVSGGGDSQTGNNTASDPYTVADRASDLTIAKSHAGALSPGQQATFTIVVSNVGAVASSGAVTVRDTLPAGLTLVAADGAGWACQPQPASVSCTRDDAVAPGASFAPIAIVAAVAPGAQSAENIAEVTGGGDASIANNTARDPYVVVSSPNLTVTKTHDSSFFVDQQAAFDIVVRNQGAAPTNGEVVVTDPLPLGLTPVSAAGDGWSCTVAGQTVECRRSDSLLPQQSWPAVSVVVKAGAVAAVLNNIVTVAGGGDLQTDDNSAADPVVIRGRPQLTLFKTHSHPVTQGLRDLPILITVSNNGSGPTEGTVTVIDALPAGLEPTDAAGDGWTCAIAAPSVTCTRADALPAARDYPVIQIRVNVASDAVTVTNEVTVSGGGDTTPADNTFRDPMPIGPAGAPNLVITKRHDADFTQGQEQATYVVGVANFGVAPTSGEVVITDDLPAGLTAVSAAGDGWACELAGQRIDCRRGDSLAPSRAFPDLTIVVRVAANASDLVNIASVTGGGDSTPVDNTASDATRIVPRVPDLTISKRHEDPFVAGQADARYELTVRNDGNGPTTGEIVLIDRVPSGLVPVSASGSGWTCGIDGATVTCRRSDTLAAGASHPPVTLTVQVQPDASNLVNVAAVSGGGDGTPDNNLVSDATSISVSPDPTIALKLASPLVVTDDAEYQALVTNLGPGSLSGVTEVVTTFPTTLVPLFGQGSGWSCTTGRQQIVCGRIGPLAPEESFSTIRYRVVVKLGPSSVTVNAVVSNSADTNGTNNEATVSAEAGLPKTGLRIVKATTTPQVAIGGLAAYRIEVTNTGEIRLTDTVVRDTLPRGFVIVEATRHVSSSQRNARLQPATTQDGVLVWPLETLAPGETLVLTYQAAVGADARRGPQENRATVTALDPPVLEAGPAQATVEVTTDVFTMLQAIVGRVFEDTDGNGLFGSGDRPLAGARVITSTGQAALTDGAGLYNIPSVGAGTVAVSLDRDTIPAGLTPVDAPGGRSWTRLLRTPIGGGSVLTQPFPLQSAAGVTRAPADSRTTPDGVEIHRVPDDPDAGRIPPRRTYETRQGSSLLIGLAEVSFGRAAQELELFEKDDDVWGYGSVFYQGPLGSSRNRLTFAADSRRRLNGTSDRDRMFELDPNDRTYPLFGDASRRQEFATSNSKVFLRAERDSSHIMYGDLVGDLPSSATDGGRWSSYQRHLTGVEVRLANARGDHVTVRGAQPDTAYARETFAGGLLGHIALANLDVLAGTETVAIEVRDRRQPERLVSREVLTRGVDYQLEPRSATIFLTRNVSTIDPRLNLVQVVVTYEYRATGVDQLVVNGRAFGTIAGLRLGATVFTEEGAQDERFTVAGIDVERALPRKGRFRLDVPYSWGTPAVTASVDARQPDANGDTGVGVQAEVEQPFPFWSGVARARFLHADEGFRNPFSATITPGAQFIGASGDLSPRSPSRLRAGGSHERHETVAVDARRTTFFGEWAETFDWLTLSAGYDDRTLDRGGSRVDSGLVTAQAIVRAGDRFEARASREENVRKDKDPTYPDQTVLGARLRVGPDAAIFYRQRISDAAIEPIGDVARTGLAALPTTGELTLGVESSLDDTTRLTSEYRLEQGVNGPDAFALVGVHTRIGLGAGLSANFGLERGQLVAGEGDDYTSGSAALAWLTNRVKATTRYEARDRTGFASLFTAGGAARLGAGVTAAARAHWTRANQPADDETLAALAAFAIRPAGHDRVGWLLSYQYADAGRTRQTVAPGRLVLGWRHLLSTDAYGQPVSWLTLHGKFAWQRSENDGVLVTDTYLAQGRLQMAISRYVDAAFEERYLHQPASRSHREGTAFEIGAWPVADFRIAVGYNFRDTRDPSGRDLQGRDRGVYLTLSTKLSRLFDLFGNRPPDPR